MKISSMEDKLTAKQREFARYYIDLKNTVQAAIKAGYSENYAYHEAYKLLENVGIKKLINEGLEAKYNREVMPISERKARLSQFAREEILGKHGQPIRTSNIQAIALLEQMDGRSGTQININIEDLKIAILNAKQDDTKLITENKPKLHLTESTYSQKNE